MDQMEETDEEKERYKVKLRNSNQEMATSCLYHFGTFAPSQTLATTALTDATVSAALRLGNADLRPERSGRDQSSQGEQPGRVRLLTIFLIAALEWFAAVEISSRASETHTHTHGCKHVTTNHSCISFRMHKGTKSKMSGGQKSGTLVYNANLAPLNGKHSFTWVCTDSGSAVTGRLGDKEEVYSLCSRVTKAELARSTCRLSVRWAKENGC